MNNCNNRYSAKTYGFECNIYNSLCALYLPAKGWRPKHTKFSLRFLYTVAKVFK